MKRFKVSLIILVILSLGCNSSQSYTVTEVRDGDTIVLNTGTVVRLAHIDAPEYNQPWGDKAFEFVRRYTLNEKITLKRYGRDKYGRTLAEVILPNNRNLNQMLVFKGLAWHYKRYSRNRRYRLLEVDARHTKRGLWSDPKPIAPWHWRHGWR